MFDAGACAPVVDGIQHCLDVTATVASGRRHPGKEDVFGLQLKIVQSFHDASTGFSTMREIDCVFLDKDSLSTSKKRATLNAPLLRNCGVRGNPSWPLTGSEVVSAEIKNPLVEYRSTTRTGSDGVRSNCLTYGGDLGEGFIALGEIRVPLERGVPWSRFTHNACNDKIRRP